MTESIIARAKGQIEAGDYQAATALALVGIAELLVANTTATYLNAVQLGAEAVADALGQVSG